MRKEENGFYSIDSSKLLQGNKEPYVLPEHCQQAFFYKKPDGDSFWHIVHVNPRGQRIFDSTLSDAREEHNAKEAIIEGDLQKDQDTIEDESMHVEPQSMPQDVDTNDLMVEMEDDNLPDVEIEEEIIQQIIMEPIGYSETG